MLSLTPLIVCAVYLQTTYVAKYTKEKLSALSASSSVAEEIVSNIRTVFAFNNEHFEGMRFSTSRLARWLVGSLARWLAPECCRESDSKVAKAYVVARKTALAYGLADGVVDLLINLSVVVGLVASSFLVLNGELTAGKMISYLLFATDTIIFLGQL